MPYDETLADLMRADLGVQPGLSEKHMFGGLAFLLHGNMVCGVHKGGAMYRVGKAQETAALALPGARPMDFTGRRMGGFIEVDPGGFEDMGARARWTEMALTHAHALPPK